MGHSQPMQTNSQEQFVQVPINNEEHSSSTLINHTGTSNRSRIIKWPTIIICVILVITGQSIARLLENYYYLHTNNKRRGTWIQSLLQVIGLPFIHTPLYLFLYSKKRNQLPLCSDRTCLKYLYLLYLYPCIGVFMVVQARLSARGKLEIPFNVFTLVFTTQLLFTVFFSLVFNKFKFNRWNVLSFILAIAAGSLTLNSSFPGEPDEDKVNYVKGVISALVAAFIFSCLVSTVQSIFDEFTSKRDVTINRNPSFFAYVVELIFLSSIVATVFSVAAVFISGEHHILKRDFREFSEGKKLYVITMMGQIISWLIYWVGLVGLAFSVSSLFSNVISVCTWPIVSVLAVLFFDFEEDKFDAFKAAALACAFLSAASYFYTLHKEKRNHQTTS